MLTIKQEKFVQNLIKGMTQREAYKDSYNATYDDNAIDNCIAIYVGNYKPYQQYAASILLKMFLKENYPSVMNEIKELLGYKINNRNSSKVIVWKNKIKKRGKCEMCGSNQKLVAHHIIPWEHSISGRVDISNGQCLCERCHKIVHNDFMWIDYLRGCN